MSGPLWTDATTRRDTLPRIPRQPPRWAADPLAELADRLGVLISAAVHPDEIAAILESDGMTDDHIRLTYGRDDSFALAEDLFARVPRAYPEPEPEAPPGSGGVWRVGLAGCLLRGLVFALPGLAYVLGSPFLAGGPEDGRGLPAGTEVLLAGTLTGWAWNQALAHRAYAWLGLGDRPAAARALLLGAPAGALLGTGVAVAVAGPGEGGAVAFAAAQAAYQGAATALLVLGRERLLLYALAPMALGALLTLAHEVPSPARAALLAGSGAAVLTLAGREVLRAGRLPLARPAPSGCDIPQLRRVASSAWPARFRTRGRKAQRGREGAVRRSGRARREAPALRATSPLRPPSAERPMWPERPSPAERPTSPQRPTSPERPGPATRTTSPERASWAERPASPERSTSDPRPTSAPPAFEERGLGRSPSSGRGGVGEDSVRAAPGAGPRAFGRAGATASGVPRRGTGPASDGTRASGRGRAGASGVVRAARRLWHGPGPGAGLRAFGRSGAAASGVPRRGTGPASDGTRASGRGRAGASGVVRVARRLWHGPGPGAGLRAFGRSGAAAAGVPRPPAGIARRLGRGPGKGGAGPPLLRSLPYGVIGLATGVLVLHAVLQNTLTTAASGVVAAPGAVALTLSMGPAEWLLYRFRRRTDAALRRSTTAPEFRRTATVTLAQCLGAYLAVLLALLAATTLLWLGAPVPDATRATALLLTGVVLWTGLLLQAFGAVAVAATVCAAAAFLQTAALFAGPAVAGTAALAVPGLASATLAALVCVLLGRATAHRH